MGDRDDRPELQRVGVSEGTMESRTVTDEGGRHWNCRLLRSSSQLVLECRSAPNKAAVLVPVGADWEAMAESELARRIMELEG